jgi:hypothetical protein
MSGFLSQMDMAKDMKSIRRVSETALEKKKWTGLITESRLVWFNIQCKSFKWVVFTDQNQFSQTVSHIEMIREKQR